MFEREGARVIKVDFDAVRANDTAWREADAEIKRQRVRAERIRAEKQAAAFERALAYYERKQKWAWLGAPGRVVRSIVHMLRGEQ